MEAIDYLTDILSPLLDKLVVFNKVEISLGTEGYINFKAEMGERVIYSIKDYINKDGVIIGYEINNNILSIEASGKELTLILENSNPITMKGKGYIKNKMLMESLMDAIDYDMSLLSKNQNFISEAFVKTYLKFNSLEKGNYSSVDTETV